MRNRILFSADYPRDLASDPSFLVLDVSLILSEAFKDSGSDLEADSFSIVATTLRNRVQEATKTILFSNFGILCEPQLHLNASKLFLDFALDYEVILYWTYQTINARRLVWDATTPQFGIEFEQNILHRMEQPT